jgi:hypothetical protein
MNRTWLITGFTANDPDTHAAPPGRRLAAGFTDRAAAERWLARHGAETDCVNFTLSMEPVPPGKPAERRDTWETFYAAEFGAVVSHRNGRRL